LRKSIYELDYMNNRDSLPELVIVGGGATRVPNYSEILDHLSATVTTSHLEPRPVTPDKHGLMA